MSPTPPPSPVPSPACRSSPPGSPTALRVEERLDMRPDLLRPERLDTPPIFQPSNYPANPSPGYSPGILNVSPPGSPTSVSLPDDTSLVLATDMHSMLNGDVTPTPPSIREEEINASGPEPYGIDFTPSPTRNVTPPPPEIPHEEKNGPVIPSDSPDTKTFNKELRMSCFKEVKKPGRDFRKLFDQLKTVQGSHDSRLKMVKDVIHEASRFKRHSLVKLLSQFLESMVGAEKGIVIRSSVRVNGHSR